MEVVPDVVRGVFLAWTAGFGETVFPKFVTLLLGAVLTTGWRTVSRVLPVVGELADADPSSYHRVLSMRRWSMRSLARPLVQAILDTFLPQGVVCLVGDKTVTEHPGRKVFGKGRHRDAKELAPVHPDAAGNDVHSEFHFVEVPEDRDPQPVRKFGAFTAELHALADWLAACGITSVAMESTGVYWIPLYELLQQRGFEVMLVDPRKLKSVPGRKSDVIDCQWLRQLHTYGLLAAAFRPDEQTAVLRAHHAAAGHAGGVLGRGVPFVGSPGR